ncbi:MAG: hypothetical protein NTW38_03210 [Candidatus Aminicenantes bacterium]|nr:hypothetical protein [Candidatus Aminicenantes bacterium]
MSDFQQYDLKGKEKFGIVVLLDALGMRTSNIEDSMKYLIRIDRLRQVIDITLSRSDDFPKDLPDIKYRFFGDSILLTCEIPDMKLFKVYLNRISVTLNVLISLALIEEILEI